MNGLMGRGAVWIWLLLVLAVFTYGFGLDSVDIPSNGDEHVYLHIARKTFETGHWLPLTSDLLHTRNTKPPLLFWQAMISGAGSWTLWSLRLPSLVYTMATALLTLLVTQRLTRNPSKAAVAALFYLGCYSVYRYGRPLLTDAPESFWLSIIVLPMAIRPPAARTPHWTVLLCWGCALGLACLYKSFVLIAPIATLYLLSVSERRSDLWIQRLLSLGILCLIAGACFAIWPLLDSDPLAIWREFVIGENVGKLGAGSYFTNMWRGGSSIPGLFGALLLDGGALAPLLLGLIILGWRSRREWSSAERTLWLWVIILFVMFAIPSQRSGRYLLPALPAMSVLLAYRAEAIPRFYGAISSVLVIGVSIAFLVLVAAAAGEAGSPLQVSNGFWMACTVALLLAVVGMWRRDWTVVGPAGGSVALMLAMGLFLRSYDAPQGPFSDAARNAVAGATVYAPCDFVVSEEAYRFMLPRASVRSYDLDWHLPLAALATHRYFIARSPLDAPVGCDGCRVLGARILVHGRLGSDEWRDIRNGNIVRHLLMRDVLVESMNASESLAAEPEACTPEGRAAHLLAVEQ